MKICIKCNQEKEIDEFPAYKSRKGEIAYKNTCKKCMAIYKSEHYTKNKVAYLSRAKVQREKDPEAYKSYLKKYYRDNKDELKEKQKEYMNTPIARKLKSETYKRYWSNPSNTIKNKARSIVNHAIRDGKLINPMKCECCGVETFTEAHHEDYNKPLDVNWLCKTCHENKHHLNEGQESRRVTTKKPPKRLKRLLKE
jgi:hypothetical protein